MVQAAGLLIFGTTSSLSVGALALTTSAGALTFGGIAINIGASLLLSTALSSRGPQSPRPEDVVQNFRSPVAPRQVHMGRVKVGGSMAMPPRAKDGKLYTLLVQMHGEIEEREAHFVDGREVTLDGSGFVTDDRYQFQGSSNLQLEFRDGQAPSAAYQTLIDTFPDWTAQHRLDGLATALAVAEAPSATKFNAMFPNRGPEYSSVIKGKRITDPRTGVVGYSENPIVHLYQYMREEMGLTDADLILSSFTDAADDCDDQLASSEGVVSRYRISGSYSRTDPYDQVIQNILATCDGEIYPDASGRYGVRVGKEISATVTLDQEHLLDILDWSNGPEILRGYTSLKSQYVDQDLGFTSQTIDPFQDQDLIDRYGQEIFGPEPNFGMSPSHIQTRFLSKIKLKKDNPINQGVFRYNLHGLKAIGETFVNINVDVADFGVQLSGPVKVTDTTLNGGQDGITFVDVSFDVIDPDAYTRTVADEGVKPQPVSFDDSETFPPVENFAAGPSGGGVAVVWDAPNNQSLLSRVEYKPAGVSDWQVSISEFDGASVIISPFTGAMDVRHAWISPGDTTGDFEVITGAQGGATIPLTGVTGLTATTDGASDVRVMFNAPNLSNIWKVEVYRNSTLILSQGVAPDEAVNFLDTPPSQTGQSYEVRALSIDAQTASEFANT